jgi:hypothetical protein
LVEEVLFKFHEYLSKEGEMAQLAIRLGVNPAEPQVGRKIVMPNLTVLSPATPDDNDPSLHLLFCAQQMMLMSTNTLGLLAEILAIRGPAFAHASDKVGAFADGMSESMTQFANHMVNRDPVPTSRIIT